MFLRVIVLELTSSLLSLALLSEFLIRRRAGVVFNLVVLVLVSQVTLLADSNLILDD
jgi:hypothetical protein